MQTSTSANVVNLADFRERQLALFDIEPAGERSSFKGPSATIVVDATRLGSGDTLSDRQLAHRRMMLEHLARVASR